MSFEQWEFGERPELRVVRYVRIQGKRFELSKVVEVLEGLLDADIMEPIIIWDRALGQALCAEGMAYENIKGSYGGTELGRETLEKLYPYLDAKMAEGLNPQLKYAYMDSTTFDHECGKTNTETYASPEDVKVGEPCAGKGECGIVKVIVYATEVVEWPKE